MAWLGEYGDMVEGWDESGRDGDMGIGACRIHFLDGLVTRMKIG